MKKKLSLLCIALFPLFLTLGALTIFASIGLEKGKSDHDQNTRSIYVVGDSTASNYSSNFAPRAGWGQVFGEMFDQKIVVKNHAASGRSSKSFIDEGRLTDVLNQIEKGDYLFIQFGHNDQKNDDPSRYTEPSTTYKSYLKQYIDGAYAKDALPVLVTSVERRRFTDDGQARDSLGDYPQALRELGAELHVPVIDLTTKSKALYQEVGPEETKKVFLWLEADEHENYPDGVQDNTHFQENGARLIAKLVAHEIKELKLRYLHSHVIQE
ncbi:rhamnogalacturonan acetylesterase [Bacillus solitudinis]|uniref:rhamnogalacturonan acetylesterase n=1 Tax=Bacillus solitudinis TaxID=2014074 RepID=UPI000C232E58|nr:rhamnogalacturonan acetylesterase [Bacillus solitudinis]